MKTRKYHSGRVILDSSSISRFHSTTEQILALRYVPVAHEGKLEQIGPGVDVLGGASVVEQSFLPDLCID